MSRRFVYFQKVSKVIEYKFAVIYYKDAGDFKTVWLRDETFPPVQIATWPKRVPLFQQQLYTQSQDTIQGYVGFWGGQSRSLDDTRTTQGANIGTLSPYNNTVDIQVSLLSEQSSISSNFAGITALPAGFGSGGFYNFSGLQALTIPSSANSRSAFFSVYDSTLGSTWSAAFESVSNNYGVIGLTKMPSKILFALADKPAISNTEIPNLDRNGRIIHGSVGNIITTEYPTIPSYDADFDDPLINPSFAYRGGLNLWRFNDGSGVEQRTTVSSISGVIGSEFGTCNVFNHVTEVFSQGVQIPGIESEAERIIAVVALAV